MEVGVKTIKETLKRIAVGHPRTFAGLSVYPLTGATGPRPRTRSWTTRCGQAPPA